LTGRVPWLVYVTEHAEATVVQLPVTNPAVATKFTEVPFGTGLPSRSATRIVKRVVMPSVFQASILSLVALREAEFCVAAPVVTTKPKDDAAMVLSDANVAVTETVVGNVPEATVMLAKPLLSVVTVCAAVLVVPLCENITPEEMAAFDKVNTTLCDANPAEELSNTWNLTTEVLLPLAALEAYINAGVAELNTILAALAAVTLITPLTGVAPVAEAVKLTALAPQPDTDW
jgi:hypothetical protein